MPPFSLIGNNVTGRLLSSISGFPSWKETETVAATEARIERRKIVIEGPFGTFQRDRLAGLRLFTSMEGDKVKTAGTFLLCSGSFTNHTSFGELPMKLAHDGWDVKVLVLPGFENEEAVYALRTLRPFGITKAWGVAANWVRMIRTAFRWVVQNAVKTIPGQPIHIGGHSFGAPVAMVGYAGLPIELQPLISGLLFAAPAFALNALHTGRGTPRWSLRHLMLPAGAMFLKNYQFADPANPDKPIIDTALDPSVSYTLANPYAALYATILLDEYGTSLLSEIPQRSDLPVTLLWPERETIIHPLAKKRVQQAFPQLRTVELAGGVHPLFISPDREKAFNEVKKFLG
jgi:alpha-beta hydrolase superfamily lysophospholipase